MKKQLFSLLLVLSFVFSVSAQTAKPARVDAVEAGLRKNIEYLASDKLEGRRTGSDGAMVAAGYITNQFAKLRLKPGARSENGKANFMQAFPYSNPKEPGKSVTGYNIIGILEGTDKTLKNEAIVIGAHYDHLGRGGEGSLAPTSTDIHHGADDNASGTAAMIELARLFSKEKKNKRTIIFIAFSGEEEGLIGSKFYTNNPSFPIEKTIAMINLDMVGRLNNGKLNVGGIGTAAEWRQLVEAKNTVESPATVAKPVSNGAGVAMLGTALALRYELALTEDGFGPSDHASFYMKKIPVLFFFTGTHMDYHKPTDTAEKINYSGESGLVSYVASIAKSVDQNPVRPTYTVAKSSGNTGGRAGFTISLGTIPSYSDGGDGMVIDGVRDDSPASRAGLKEKDKIVKLAGMDIKSVQDYMKAMGEMKAGEEYEIVFVRGSETMTKKIVPVKRQ